MEIGTLIGTVGLILVLVFGITFDQANLTLAFGNFVYFIDIPSIIIVLFGTIVGTIMSYPLDRFTGIFKVIGSVFKEHSISPIKTLATIIDVAKVARKNVLAIEDALPSLDNEYLRNGLRLVVDRVDRELIIEILQAEMKYLDQRKESDANIIKLMATLSPAFGMIGTLMGLVVLLQNLDDPSKIGPAMAVALITTMYGALFSNGFFLPWYTKLMNMKDDDQTLYEMVRDGILFIEKNERPEFIEQDLMNYLSPDLKKKYEDLKFSSGKGN